MTPVTITQLRASATVDLMTAARALGLGRTKAYELARRDQFPCRVIRIGETYRIPTAGLLELLGVAAEEPRSRNGPRPAAPDHSRHHSSGQRKPEEPPMRPALASAPAARGTAASAVLGACSRAGSAASW